MIVLSTSSAPLNLVFDRCRILVLTDARVELSAKGLGTTVR